MSSLVIPDPEKIRLIISDVDGTLLNSQHKLTERTIKTINEVIEKYNINFVIATGKTRYSSIDIRKHLNIMNKPNCPAIHTNGCIIYNDKNEIIEEIFIDNKIILDNIEFYKNLLKGKDYAYTLYSGDVLYFVEDNHWAQVLRDFNEDVVIIDENELFEKLKSNEIKTNKLCAFSQAETISEIEPKVAEYLKQYDNISYTKGYECCIETIPKYGNKGNALKYIMKTLNLKPEEVIAFGDSSNDLSMFEVAGYKYSMENGINELKDLSTSVTKSNDEDGLAYILEKTFLEVN